MQSSKLVCGNWEVITDNSKSAYDSCDITKFRKRTMAGFEKKPHSLEIRVSEWPLHKLLYQNTVEVDVSILLGYTEITQPSCCELYDSVILMNGSDFFLHNLPLAIETDKT